MGKQDDTFTIPSCSKCENSILLEKYKTMVTTNYKDNVLMFVSATIFQCSSCGNFYFRKEETKIATEV